MRTLVRLFDEEGQGVRGRIFTDAVHAEEYAADSLGMETSLGLTIAVAKIYARTECGDGWILHGEMEY